MASAKKKTSAKRTVKYAAKSQASAAQTSAKAGPAKAAQNASAKWTTGSAADWQKGASDWAKQSAKLYQLPFAQADAGAATQQMKSATEDMMKMGSDMMQQFFGQAKQAASQATAGSHAAQAFNPAAMFAQAEQLKQFNPAAAQEKMSSFARESVEQISKSTGNANRAMQEAMELSRANAEVLAKVSNHAMASSKELAADLTGYLNKLFSQNAELSKQVLSCRTLNDMFDLASRVMKTNLEGFFSESVKMSEKMFTCATDIADPLNECVSQTTQRLTKVMSA